MNDYERGQVESRIKQINEYKASLADIERNEEISRALGLSDAEIGASGGQGNAAPGSLFGAVKAAGWDRKTNNAVIVPSTGVALATGHKEGSFSGTVGEDPDFAPATRRDGPLLGADGRFAYPAVRTQPVDAGTTSVPGFRQVSRNLGDISQGDRAIDDTSTKPEVSTEAEVYSVPMRQFAFIQSGTPNVLLESSTFRSYMDTDLRLAYSEVVDANVLNAISAASPDLATGINLLEAILYGAESIASDGYAADLLLLTPQNALDLALLRQPGTDDYVAGRMDVLLGGLEKRICKNASDPFLMDRSAAGVLYLSPTAFASFEENAGSTNSTTLRLESHGAFNVERSDAIRVLGLHS
jgi:hypothetical protein